MRALRHACAICLSILIWVATPLDAQAGCSRDLRVVYVDDYVPYQFRDKNGLPMGLDIALYREILARAGCRFHLVNYPPKRAHHLMKMGQVDLMGAASITPERQEYAMFSKGYREERIVLFHRGNDPRGASVGALDDALGLKLRVAAGAGGWYGPDLNRLRPALKSAGLLQENSSTLQRMRMLLAERVHLVIADIYVGYHHARSLDRVQDVRHRPRALNDEPVHLMLARASLTEADRALVNRAIERFVISADYRRLIAGYLGKDISY